jgi:hypothetical protein
MHNRADRENPRSGVPEVSGGLSDQLATKLGRSFDRRKINVVSVD